MRPSRYPFRRPVWSLFLSISAALVAPWGSEAQAQPAVSQAAPCTTPEPKAEQSVGPCVQPCYYFTGFEPEEGFTAGAWIGDGNQGAAGGVFTTWNARCSEVWGSSTEAHIDTANPSSGSQHLRFTVDPAVAPEAFNCVIDARVPTNAVADANTPPIAPTTISVEIAIDGIGGQDFNIQPQTRWTGCSAARLLYYYYGNLYVLDDPGDGLTFVSAGPWDDSGAYHRYNIHIDPCDEFRCQDGSNAGALCDSDADCGPEVWAFCAGRVDYLVDGELRYQAITYLGPNMDQLLFYGDNYGVPGEHDIDIDNVEIIRATSCPGACCDAFADCTDAAQDIDCAGTFILGEPCSSAQCPTATLGACCDRLTGGCTETSPSSCGGNTTFTLGSHCSEVDCPLALGACCNSSTGEC